MKSKLVILFIIITIGCHKLSYDEIKHCDVEYKVNKFYLKQANNYRKYSEVRFFLNPEFQTRIITDDPLAECIKEKKYIDFYDSIVFTTVYDYNSLIKANDTINNILGNVSYFMPKTYNAYYFDKMNDFLEDTLLRDVGYIKFGLLFPPDSARKFNINCWLKLKDGRKFTFSMAEDIIVEP